MTVKQPYEEGRITVEEETVFIPQRTDGKLMVMSGTRITDAYILLSTDAYQAPVTPPGWKITGRPFADCVIKYAKGEVYTLIFDEHGQDWIKFVSSAILKK